MAYNPEIHHRHSLRLKGYDYSSPGNYFITICTQNRECLFGSVEELQMRTNDPGKIAEKWWLKLKDKFDFVDLDKFIVMPNHVHGLIKIIRNGDSDGIVGANPCVRPETEDQSGQGQTHGSAPTLGKFIQWFKTMSTNEYLRGIKLLGWPPFYGRLWQRNYYDEIVRIEQDLYGIRKYVANNPAEWENDENNPNNIEKKKSEG